MATVSYRTRAVIFTLAVAIFIIAVLIAFTLLYGARAAVLVGWGVFLGASLASGIFTLRHHIIPSGPHISSFDYRAPSLSDPVWIHTTADLVENPLAPLPAPAAEEIIIRAEQLLAPYWGNAFARSLTMRQLLARLEWDVWEEVRRRVPDAVAVSSVSLRQDCEQAHTSASARAGALFEATWSTEIDRDALLRDVHYRILQRHPDERDQHGGIVSLPAVERALAGAFERAGLEKEYRALQRRI